MASPSAAVDAGLVLIVDDEPLNVDLLEQELDAEGFRTQRAASGEAALAQAGDVRPDLILLDVMMSGIDGYETCRRLKADPDTREAAVIFLSSLDDTKDKVRGLEVGAVDFISKPFQSDEVVARVNAHLTLQRLRRQLEARNARTLSKVSESAVRKMTGIERVVSFAFSRRQVS